MNCFGNANNVWTNVTVYICKQTLLFLLVGRDFLSSEEETEQENNPNQQILRPMEKAAE